ncbi:kinase-like protein [Plenodomus tracheiphilus IPT5]|uniref:non-specific serine/threonine protein kinase n=1 Tax=Plenodomus tracheiphilus IPT5 TaxID=1408161 RepID=A0A6A7AWN5_9PLEO|nr:kinase-like protein [Plenodomus tracheiphilus IPT5]
MAVDRYAPVGRGWQSRIPSRLPRKDVRALESSPKILDSFTTLLRHISELRMTSALDSSGQHESPMTMRTFVALSDELASLLRKDIPCWEDFLGIRACLRQLRYPPVAYSNPKLFYILQKLDRRSALYDFLDAAFTDAWLPFPDRTLRRLLQPREIEPFKALQILCFDDSPPFLNEYRHFALKDAFTLGLEEQELLGSGGFGEVHAVEHQRTGRVYALKTMSRPGVHKDHVVWMTNFEREIQAMQRVKNRHCVELVASITDLESCRLLCSPVADKDLSQLLEGDLTPHMEDVLRGAIGCVTAALVYLHTSNIRHGDLKINNILIKGGRVFLTDFGSSLDFSDSCISTTFGQPANLVRKYSAPEVFEQSPRSRLTDIWSLGCVLLEMLSRICGHKPSAMKSYWLSHGTCRNSYADNSDATGSWVTQLIQSLLMSDLASDLNIAFLMAFVFQVLMQRDRLLRPTAVQVLDRLKDVDVMYERLEKESATIPLSWVHECCYQQSEYVAVLRPDYAYYSDENLSPVMHGRLKLLISDPLYGITGRSLVFLDLGYNILHHSPNLDPWFEGRTTTQISLMQLIRFGDNWSYFQEEFIALIESLTPSECYATSARFLTVDSMYRSMLTSRQGDTPMKDFLIKVKVRDDVNNATDDVRTTLIRVKTCFEREKYFGTPFVVLMFDHGLLPPSPI